MSGERKVFKAPIIGQLTQGSIINGCIAELLPGEEVFGCVITPRCALSHDGKIETVHYLPLIPFKRWFDLIAKPIIEKEWKNDCRNALNAKFHAAKAGTSIMDAMLSYEDMIRICEEKVSKEKDKEIIRNLLNAYYDRDDEAFNKYISKGEGAVKTQIKRLIRNEHTAYYLLESWKKQQDPSHYVIMLRDVRRIQLEFAERISEGVFLEDLPPINTAHNDLFISAQKDAFFYVETEITSPFVEHILQAFVQNFSKVGVDDIAEETQELLMNSLK